MENTYGSFDNQNEDFSKLVGVTKKMNSFWEAYNLNLSNQNTVDKTLLNFYSEYFLMAAILEAFISNENLSLKELNNLTWNYVPKDFVWKVPVQTYHSTILKMIRIGYVETIENKDESLPRFKITELGIKTLQEQTLQNLASTSFFNFQAHDFNKKSFTINLLAILVALISLIVAIIALIK